MSGGYFRTSPEPTETEVACRAGLGAWLSRDGILRPPRDVAGMVRGLVEKGYLGVPGEQSEHISFERKDDSVMDRLNQLLDG